MNLVDVGTLRLACDYMEDGRLVALAAVALGGGTATEATEAVRTRTVLGGSREAGTVWASPAGLRVWNREPARPEQWVTWTQVATVLTPVLRGDLGVELLAAHHDRSTSRLGDVPEAVAVTERRWRRVKAAVFDTAFSAVSVQPSLFDHPVAPPPPGRRAASAGRSL